MTDLIRTVDSPQDITSAAAELRRIVETTSITPNQSLEVFEAWGSALGQSDTADLPGVPFLRLWLRRNTLEPIITKELGPGALNGDWSEDGRARLKAYPVGVVGHWPAGNIEIQPLLSMTCALLGGNACLARIPTELRDVTSQLIAKLIRSDRQGILTSRIRLLAFDHARLDLHRAMAQSVDGAMIWGGEEAVSEIRSLPFPSWARLAVFGPRVSVAAMDAASWNDPATREALCRRFARDVWQFDQQACSSPQVLFLEKKNGEPADDFVQALRTAFEAENRAHPRGVIEGALTSAICQARASWLLKDERNSAVFPLTPAWTILVGRGPEMPQPTQGKTLAVLEVPDLLEALARLDGNVQTLGLAIADPEKETAIASLAASRGIDRIVPLGRMHVFGPPWDGVDLIRIMVRMVRHLRPVDGEQGRNA
ncbi:MAG: acyl-CoA reductase [Candidatus Korobacteraceae bacterium]